jgi:hypothetical protein
VRGPRLAAVGAAAVLCALLTGPVAVLDEESYLEIAAQLPWARPYDWWRPWQPAGAAPAPDTYLFAHPPLFLWWVKVWAARAPTAPAALYPLKLAAALPWAMLFGWATGRLAERLVPDAPRVAIALVLGSPVVLLGLQRGLMPDLMVAALGAAAVACAIEDAPGRAWWVPAGLLLGAAASTKYPALLLFPLIAAVGHARGRVPWAALGLGAALWLGVELALTHAYGRPHLFEVLRTADTIGRGPLPGRLTGAAVRLGFVLLPLPFLSRRWAALWVLAAALALVLGVFGAPTGLPLPDRLALAAFALPGAFLLVVLGLHLRIAQGHGAAGADALLLSAWPLLVFLGVALGHNFAAPRYLLPAALPLALLVARLWARSPLGRGLLGLTAAAQLALGLALSHAERQAAAAADAAALAALAEVPAPRAFAGEWAFRHRLRAAGVPFWTGGPLPPGTTLILPDNSAPPAAPAGWIARPGPAFGRHPLRLVDPAVGVGFYGETIGPFPLGRGTGPLEQLTLWTAP